MCKGIMEKEDLYNLFNGFNSRSQAYKYFGFSDNSNGIIRLKKMAETVGFDLHEYENRRKPPKKRCKYCGKEFQSYGNIFCSRHCSAAHTNKNRIVSEETKNKIRKALTKPKIKKNKICKICGQEKCVNNEICHHPKTWFLNLMSFSFDIEKLGTKEIFKEYYRIKELILKEYFDNQLSPKDIARKYNYDKNSENILHILKSFGIKTRNLSESGRNAWDQGKLTLKYINNDNGYQYKHGWHITWNGKKIYYRSSYELKLAIELDQNKIDYETEYFRIKYWDSQLMRYRVAIPDFFIVSDNKIIEVKSRVTFNKQNIIDKFNEYVRLGFDVLLVYEHKEYKFNEIQNIEECHFKLGK